MKRRMGVEDSKIKFNLAAPNLEIDVPEEAFLAEGLQIIKRAVANDVFKFVPSVKTIKFTESYQAPAEKKAEEKPATAEAPKK